MSLRKIYETFKPSNIINVLPEVKPTSRERPIWIDEESEEPIDFARIILLDKIPGKWDILKDGSAQCRFNNAMEAEVARQKLTAHFMHVAKIQIITSGSYSSDGRENHTVIMQMAELEVRNTWIKASHDDDSQRPGPGPGRR